MDCWRAASRCRRSAVSDASAASHSGFWVRGDGPVVGVVKEVVVLVVVVCKTGAEGFAVVCACACACVVEAGMRFIDVGAGADAGADAGDVALDPPPPPSPSPTIVPAETKREDVDMI